MDILGVVGSPAPGTFNYYFPNDQSARLVFYHDRAPDCCGGANRCEGSAPAAEAAARGSGAPRTTWRHDSSAWHSGERPDAQRGLRQFGRLIQRLGTTQPLYEGTFARNYEDTPTEMPVAGAVEAWRIFNLSGDTHPIHFHLVNVQVVSRQAFDVRRLRFLGPARPPDANERGWKETVRMNPGECITVILKFDLAPAPFSVPTSPGTGGHE